MSNDITEQAGHPSTSPLDDYVTVTPGSSALANGTCRAIIVDADGTLDLTTPDGTDRDGVLVFKGVNPYVASKIRAASGPTVIIAGY